VTDPEISTALLEETDGGKALNYSGPFDRLISYRKNLKTISHAIKPGKTLPDILTQYGIGGATIQKLVETCCNVCDLKRLVSGRNMVIILGRQKGNLIHMDYSMDDDDNLCVGWAPSGFWPSRVPIDIESVKETATICGVIKDPLYESAITVGFTPQLVLDFADIFAWDIGFFVDIRRGDRFVMAFEKEYRSGSFLRTEG